jgi:hypothetical protein
MASVFIPEEETSSESSVDELAYAQNMMSSIKITHAILPEEKTENITIPSDAVIPAMEIDSFVRSLFSVFADQVTMISQGKCSDECILGFDAEEQSKFDGYTD